MEKKFSAADLIKCSARQMVYLANKKERIASYLQMKGVEYQSRIVADEKNHGIVADEMRGCYNCSLDGDDITIFFCIDMVKDGKFYEIKMNNDIDGNVRTDYEPWYFQISLLQCAFYKSLLLKMHDHTLYTPKFRIKEGFEKAALQINPEWDYILKFGEIGEFVVDVVNPDKIIDFYKNKIANITDYDAATDFDREFKHKEFKHLEKYIVYRQIA